MSQSRLMSFVESWANVAIGYGVNLIGNLIILPVFGLHVTVTQAVGIGLWFTAISVCRSYLIRRWFNGFKR